MGWIITSLGSQKFCVKDQCTHEEEEESCLETVFEDGKLCKEYTLEDIRNFRRIGAHNAVKMAGKL